MTERPPGLDELLNYVVTHLNCAHGGGSYFDRTVCPDPCGSMHYRCKHCGDVLDPCPPQALPEPGTHHPMLVRWGSRHGLPAEVCDTCSVPEAGSWVAIAFCDKARAKSLTDPDCAYTYGVISPKDAPE